MTSLPSPSHSTKARSFKSTRTAAREIPLSRGLVAIVDAADFEWLSQWKWHAHASRSRLYAARNTTLAERGAGNRTLIYMHRVLTAPAAGLVTDHANGDSLDNRRQNLRPATVSQNAQNAVQLVGISGYRGLSAGACGGWESRISAANKAHYLGTFRCPVAAAKAYDDAARRLHGDYAILNFPEAGENGF